MGRLAGKRSARNLNAPNCIFKTGSIYAVGDNLTATGTFNGRACEITVGTDSKISIVRPDVLS